MGRWMDREREEGTCRRLQRPEQVIGGGRVGCGGGEVGGGPRHGAVSQRNKRRWVGRVSCGGVRGRRKVGGDVRQKRVG